MNFLSQTSAGLVGGKGADWRHMVWRAEQESGREGQGQGWKGKDAETKGKENRIGRAV